MIIKHAVVGILTNLRKILHFYLLVRACNDTSDKRSQEISTRAAMIATQIVKKMEERGTFYRRDSRPASGYRDMLDRDVAGYDIELGNLHNDTGFTSAYPDSSSVGRTSRAPTVRSGRSRFSETRTQFSHTRSMSVPVPTSPRSLRTARTDEPSLYGLGG